MLVGLMLLLLAQTSALPVPPALALPIHRTVLPNGHRVLVVPRGNAAWCAVATVFPGGSHADPVGRSGLAHLAEHLLFEETATRADRDAESLGMLSNAFTLEDHTVLVDEFSPAVLDQALALHVDRFIQPAPLSAGQLQREIEVVMDERRFRVDEPPTGRAEEQVVAQLWNPSPWGRPVLGWPVELQALRVEDVRRWMATTLAPARAVTVVVGAVDPAQVSRLLTSRLTTWHPTPPTTPPVLAASIPTPAPVVRVSGPQPAVVLALKAADEGTPEAAADAVLARMLSGAPVGDAQLELDVRPRTQGSTVLWVVMPEGGGRQQTAAQVWDQVGPWLRAAAAGEAPQDVVESMRLAAAWEHVRSIQGHGALAQQLAADEALRSGPPWTFHKAQHMARVTPQQLARRAQAWLSQRPAAVAVQGP